MVYLRCCARGGAFGFCAVGCRAGEEDYGGWGERVSDERGGGGGEESGGDEDLVDDSYCADAVGGFAGVVVFC